MITDLDLLRTFAAVIDAGGFTRAAERVHLTQSTVSQQIRKLEIQIGHPLVLRDKSGGGVRATEEGEILLSYARRLLATAAEAADMLGRPRSPRPVRLGVPEDFAGRRLIDLLAGFAATATEIRLDTVSGWSVELRRLLDLGELDLALVKRERGDGPSLATWPEELVWVAGPDRKTGRAGTQSSPGAAQPQRVPLALFPAGCVYRERAIRCMEESGRAWHIAYTSQGLMGVQAAVASGLGISLLPKDAVLAEHRYLSEAEGFPPQSDTELALIKPKGRLTREAGIVAGFLTENLFANT